MSIGMGARCAWVIGFATGTGALACSGDFEPGPSSVDSIGRALVGDPLVKASAASSASGGTAHVSGSGAASALESGAASVLGSSVWGGSLSASSALRSWHEMRPLPERARPENRPRLPLRRGGNARPFARAADTDTAVRLASIYRTYALLQIGAEALFTFRPGQPDFEAPPGTTRAYFNLAGSGHLQAGNGRASRLTEAEVELLSDWEVVQHRSNTGTGFSGTIFRYTGPSDPARVLESGQLVLSLRSTEFVDDYARDHEATNTKEVFQAGWAFGQIADMQEWFEELRSDEFPIVPRTARIDVTGYSLGGHLATAFRSLFPDAVRSVYTFNGAGVGELLNELSLGDTMAIFRGLRRSAGGVGDLFSVPQIRALYEALRPRLDVAGSRASDTDFAAIINLLLGLPDPGPQQDTFLAEVGLLRDALTRKNEILDANAYVRTLRSGDADLPNPRRVEDTLIEASRLDYQIASLVARRNTRGTTIIREFLPSLLQRRRTVLPVTPNFFDIFGATYPSVVASSQFHHGAPTPLFIEDQPLFRGREVSAADITVFPHAGVTILVDEFAHNDLGDTHSIVLLADSLGVQDALSRLEPGVSLSTFDSLFQGASRLVRSSVSETQGSAEGDVLENVLTALRRMVLNRAATPTPFDIEGGTWADYPRRQQFHEELRGLVEDSAFAELRGRVRVELPSTALGALARDDFGAFAALDLLSPVALLATDAENLAVVEQSLRPAWGRIAELWTLDRNRTELERERLGPAFSDTWLADRAALLSAVTVRNQQNVSGVSVFDASVPFGYEYEFRFVEPDPSGVDRARVLRAQPPSPPADPPLVRLFWFGTPGGETQNGLDEPSGDHIYGGEGSDTLNGLEGSDHLEGNADNDTLNGDADNDTLIGGSGLDVLDGGADSDTLIGGDNADFMIGGAGDDVLYGGAGRDNYDFGRDFGHDVIDDSDGDGVIRRQGIGEISAGAARRINDGVWESEDRNIRYTLFRGADGRSDLGINFSDDPGTILIQDYSDERNLGIRLPTSIQEPTPPQSGLRGDFHKKTEEDDPMTEFDESTRYVDDPESLNYVADGDEPGAADLIAGTMSGDWIQGLGGDDGLAGDEGDDLIEGGDGGDFLMAGGGADTLLGGDGPDVLYSSLSGIFSFPTLTTTLPPSFPGRVLATGLSWVLVAGQPDRFGFDERTFVGTLTIPLLFGDAPSVIDAGPGDDIVLTGTGSDIAELGSGIDLASGMAGDDAIFGEEGNDRIRGDGRDTMDISNIARTPGPLHGRDWLSGGGANDLLYGNGNDDVIYGGTGDDFIYGDDDDSSFTPLEYQGNDYIEAGDGNDIALGSGKNDIVSGGAGDDLLWGDDVASIVPEPNHGDDHLDGGEGGDQLVGGGGSDALVGGGGDDRLFGDDDPGNIDESAHAADDLDGGDGNDYLECGGGDDVAEGRAGTDTLFGGAGDDLMLGGDDSDFLLGEADNDLLIGGAGADYLAGGAGDDTYLVRASDLTSEGPLEFIDDQVGTSTVVFEDRAAVAVELIVLDASNLAVGVGDDRYLGINTSVGQNIILEFLDGTFTLAELLAVPR